MKSRAKFGKKLKGFIAKKVATYYDDEDDDSRLLFADEPSVQVPVTVISQCDWARSVFRPKLRSVFRPKLSREGYTNSDSVIKKKKRRERQHHSVPYGNQLSKLAKIWCSATEAYSLLSSINKEYIASY